MAVQNLDRISTDVVQKSLTLGDSLRFAVLLLCAVSMIAKQACHILGGNR